MTPSGEGESESVRSTQSLVAGQPELLDAEREVAARLGNHTLDFASLDVISNIYRAATSVRREAERAVLSAHGLSFGGFTVLWVLWVWEDLETAKLAHECGVTKGTLTGLLVTLEKQNLIARTRVAEDKRRVIASLTPGGLALIEQVYPLFNRFEGEMTVGLSAQAKRELAGMLRTIITNAEG